MFKLFSKKNKGSLTVEAALVLPLVIITLLFIANILNICMVHLCMQQALNNTAKKISQNSYLVYRFAGETNYTNFINKLNNANEGYAKFESKASDTKTAFDNFQSSAGDTISSIDTMTKTFDGFEIQKTPEYLDKLNNNLTDLKDKITNTLDKAKVVGNSLKELYKTGKENIQSIVIKLLVDTTSGAIVTSISDYIFNKYTKELAVPASRISELNSFHSSLNKDGAFTIVVSYVYTNPFSFVNQKSLEYSIINKKLRMTNAITIKPFVGKQGTSLVSEIPEIGDEIVEIEEKQVATTSDAEKQEEEEDGDNNTKDRDEKLKELLNDKKMKVHYYHNSYCVSFDIAERNYSLVKDLNYYNNALSFFKDAMGRDPSSTWDYYMIAEIDKIFMSTSERYHWEPCEHCVDNKDELKDGDIVYVLEYDCLYSDYFFKKYHTEVMCEKLNTARKGYKAMGVSAKDSADNCELSMDQFGADVLPTIADYTGINLEYIDHKKIKIDFDEDANMGVIWVPCQYCGG